MKKGRRFGKALALLVALLMAFGTVPQMAFAVGENHEAGTVKVTVENDIWSAEAGADWTGKLITDKEVAIDGSSTLLSILKSALDSEQKTMNDISTETVSEINGVANGEAGADCLWKAFVGDADTNQQFSDYSVAKGNIVNGSVIKLKYHGTVTKKSEPSAEQPAVEGSAGGDSDKAKDADEESDQDGDEPPQPDLIKKAARALLSMPMLSRSTHDNQVRVIVENNTYSEEDGAPWAGTLVDKWVDLSDESTTMSCVVDALGEYPQEGAENNYISSINGLAAKDGGDMSGWMGTLNDWFTNEGFEGFTVAAGTLAAGDEIRIMYTSNGYGEDLGGSWGNSDKTIKSIDFNKGILTPVFEKAVKEYKLTLPAGTEGVVVTPTASNKNFQVRTSTGGKEYKRNAEVPVAEGTIINVKCGDASWPTMNSEASEIPAEEYDITVAFNKKPAIKSDVNAQVSKGLMTGDSYSVDLSEIFTDGDGDTLSYEVKSDSGQWTQTDHAYSLKTTEGGQKSLVFRANDGVDYSDDTYTVNLTVTDPKTAEVTMEMQQENTFLVVPGKYTVSSNLAEAYGYEDEVAQSQSVSALDVLVKAHEVLYGSDFTKETASDYLVVDKGSISKVNSVETYSFSFAINGAFPCDKEKPSSGGGYTGYTINQASVSQGDTIDFFFYQDSMYTDYYTWFEQNGNKVESIEIGVNESIEATLTGFMYMFGYLGDKEELKKQGAWGDIDGAQLTVMNPETGAVTDIDGAVTDEKGNVSFKFSQAGTYYVSAYSDYEETYQYITSPVLKVVVKEDKSGAEGLVIRTSSSTGSLSNAILAGQNDEGVAIFNRKTLEYDLGSILLDTTSQLRFWYTLPEAGTAVKAVWDGGSKELTGSSSTQTNIANVWANCLKAGKNVIKLEVTPPEGSDNQKVTYTVKVNCKPTLTALSAKAGDAQLYMDKTFASTANDYTLTVPQTAETVNIDAVTRNNSYAVTYNGDSSESVNIRDKDKIDVAVTQGQGEDAVTNTYTIALNKVAQLNFKINASPSDAVVKVYDGKGVNVKANDDGSFSGMFAAQTYTYTVTKYGYVANTGEVPADGGAVDVVLTKAPEDNIKDLDSDWENFRNSDTNMAITDNQTPVSKDDVSLIWNKKLGAGGSAAPSVQIIVDNSLVVMSGTTIYKLDLKSGETLKTGEMAAAPNFGYTPPIYAEGMIFCPLSNGTIQAFNAETLQSLWIYSDNLKGQSLSPITYSDGYIYTGFWNGEIKDANYVCISVTDEDPSKTDETKVATWKQTQTGGFYWAGSVVAGNGTIVGTDDGTSGTKGNSKLYSFNRLTGEIISEVSLEGAGDQRSSMAYDKESGRIFFTTKGGYLCRADVDASTGAISNLKKVNYNAQSTSTPVVYKGKVYFATGSGISSTGSSGNVVVADADSLEMLYAVGLKGYPQCSLLLSTAYEDETGYIYLYSTYNSNPGGISMIKVKPEATKASDAELIELYDAAGFEQYCITSIICGKDGTLYYKNDSGNVFAIGVPDTTAVIRLIEKIGTVTLESDKAIKAARDAYDALEDSKKQEVANYNTLTAAEEAFKVLKDKADAEAKAEADKNKKPSSVVAAKAVTKAITKSVNASLGGSVKEAKSKIEQVLNPSDSVNKLPEKMEEITEVQLKSVIDAYKAYDLLSDDEKLLVDNYKDFEKVLEKIGQVMHLDKETGITIDKAEWYQKIEVSQREFSGEELAQIKEAFGQDAVVLAGYDIHVIDLLTGKKAELKKSIKVKMPSPDKNGQESIAVVHINENGEYEFIKAVEKGKQLSYDTQSFSPYAVIGFNGTWEDVMGTSEETGGIPVWIWAGLGAAALIAILIIAAMRNKKRIQK